MARAIRYAGLVLPLVLTVHGYFYAFEVIDNYNYISFETLTTITSLWLAVAIWQYIVPSRGKRLATVRLFLYHLLAASYLLFVTGILTPFVGFWIVLMIASHLYFGRMGTLLSAGSFMFIVLVDILLWGSAETVIPYDLGVLVAVLLSGMIVMSINRIRSVDQIELDRSHKQEMLQRDRILTIVNNLSSAVMSTDNNGIIRVYNAASLDLIDTNDSLNGHHIDTVITLYDDKDEPVALSKILSKNSGVQIRDDLWLKFEDGERVRLEVTMSPIRKTFQHMTSGSQDGYILIMRDVTKAKSLEEERDEFISVVSHELRTPITVVEGSLSNIELMLTKDKINKDRLLEAVQSSHAQTMYLAKMINDLSALSRAERGVADEHEVIDVRELVNKMYDTYSAEAHKKDLTFDLDAGSKLGSIEVSRLYIEEILQNIISNAIKYTKEGGVTLIVRQKQGVVTFSVKDTGIGISKTEQAKVFDKFYRSEDYRTRETGGTGLGLYVITKLARKVNTEIKLTSRLNYGSTFSFDIPAYKKPN